MEKKGKVDLLSVLIASILIFVVYAVLVLGDISITHERPVNSTNASATRGYADGSLADMRFFNATNATFNCTVRINTTDTNISNVSLFIQKDSGGTRETAAKNQTQWINITGDYILNITFNITGYVFDEGNYFWFCEAMQNRTDAEGVEVAQTNFTSINRTFTIDTTPPGLRTAVANLTPRAQDRLSTGDKFFIAVNFTDAFTTIHTVRLFVNVSGAMDNEVNTTGVAANGVNPSLNFSTNLSFVVPGIALGDVLNVTLWVNDSVNNYNITPALIFEITGDGTPPGITLNGPANMTNQTSTTMPLFNFTAYDNNETTNYNFTCDINITMGGSNFTNISNIDVINGSARVNTTDVVLSNGTYIWNVTCRDDIGNTNTSIFRVFTVDQIPPVVLYFNISNSSRIDHSTGASSGLGSPVLANVPADGLGTWAQGRSFTAFANWSDNLTTVVLEASLQFYNTSGGGQWQTINTTKDDATNNITKYATNTSTSNFTFVPPTGHNEFEGRNVSFRIIANDSLGNINTSNSVMNITIQINDTTAPTVAINGTIAANGSNITDTTPLISWYIIEGKQFTSINVSVDANTKLGTGVDTCGLVAFYDTSAGVDNVERHRNDSFTVTDDPLCTLTNGTHFVNVTAIDSSGNRVQFGHTFSVQSGSVPGLGFNLTNAAGAGTWSKRAINKTNITSAVGITLFGSSGVGSTVNIDKVSYFSSCDSTVRVESNNTIVYPFNASSCNVQSANRTLTVTINDTAGNPNATVLGFLVDNVGPSISVVSPTNGQTFNGVNVSLNFSVKDNDQAISSYGYYLDVLDGGIPPAGIINISASIGGAGINTSDTRLLNFTPGTHTIKFTVNDTLGNVQNSSAITFTQGGPIKPNEINITLSSYLSAINRNATFNVTSIRVKDTLGNFVEIGSGNRTDNNQTFELFLSLNSTDSNDQINITITDINGSGANWDKINFSVFINGSKFEAGAENNFTMNMFGFVFFNSSFEEFLSNQNDYYARVLLPYNISGNISTAQEIWYFPNSSDLTQRTNVSECTTSTVFSAVSTSLPCWNYTTGGKTILSVPHFSGAGGGNDSRPPTVTVNFPTGTQTESSFFANITVSNDAVLCNVSYRGGSRNISVPLSNRTMSGPSVFGTNKICTFHLNVTNGTIENINITFSVFDSNYNLNYTEFNFNVSDTTVHNLTSISIGSITTTGATVTVIANESVNMSVNSTGSNLLAASHYSNQSSFVKTNSITFSSLASSITYNFTVQTCDKAGNCIFNKTLGFTTSAAAADTTTSAAAAASSGGGGGGAAAVSAVTDSKAQVWQSVPAGSSVSLDVDKAAIAVTSVAVNNVKSDLKSVELEVAALSANPLSTEAAAKVYQYFRINKKNIADADAESFKITFRVTKAWLSDNKLASADIALYRFADDKWNELATTVASTDATYVNYESSTPGFSSFAVGVKSGVEVAEEAPEEAPEEVPGEEAAPVPVEAPKAVEAPSKAPVAWIIAAIVIILGIVLIVAYQKQKKKV